MGTTSISMLASMHRHDRAGAIKQKNTIVHSSIETFQKRAGNPNTHAFVTASRNGCGASHIRPFDLIPLQIP
jgi:hypothetical protein